MNVLTIQDPMYILYWFRLLSEIHFLSQLVFLPAPTVTLCSEHSASSCNEMSIPSTNSREPFLTRQTMIRSNIISLMLFIVFFTPFFNLFAHSFWLIIVICEGTCILGEVCIHIRYDRDPRLLDRMTNTAILSVSCLEVFYCIFVTFLICNMSRSPSTIFLGSLAAWWVWYFANALHLFSIWNLFLYEI